MTEKSKDSNNDINLPDEMPGLSISKGVQRLEGNQKLYIKLLKIFVRNHGNILSEINVSLAENDFIKAKYLVHTIRGIAGNISAVDLFDAAGELEKCINAEGNCDQKTYLDKFARGLKVVKKSIEEINRLEITGKNDEKSYLSIDFAVVYQLINNLDKLLKRSDLEANRYLELLKDHLKSKKFNGKMRKLEEQIDGLDFVEAQKTLRSLSEDIVISSAYTEGRRAS